MKRRIAFDVDGVLANLVGVLAEDLGRDYSEFTAPRFADDPGLSPISVARLERLMVSPGFVRRLPLYDFAAETVAKCQNAGDEVVLITHQYEASPTWVFDRQGWIGEHFPKLPVIFTREKHMVDVDVLVEDTPANAERFLEARPEARALLILQPWNTRWWRDHGDPKWTPTGRMAASYDMTRAFPLIQSLTAG